MMNERIHVADPDYAAVRFVIFQFGDDENDVHHPVMHINADVELFSLEEMEAMVATIYDLWR